MAGPAKSKHRLHFKPSIKPELGRKTSRGGEVIFGDFGIVAAREARLTDKSFDAAVRSLSKRLKGSSKIFRRVFTDIPRTKKPTEVRMGKGKGSIDSYITALRVGRVILEFSNVSREVALEMLAACRNKLGFQCRLSSRRVGLVSA